MNTQDLEKFGHRELLEAARLLLMWQHYDRTTALKSDARIELSENTGLVFLVDSACNMAVAFEGELWDYFVCQGCDHEAAAPEFREYAQPCCIKTLKECY